MLDTARAGQQLLSKLAAPNADRVGEVTPVVEAFLEGAVGGDRKSEAGDVARYIVARGLSDENYGFLLEKLADFNVKVWPFSVILPALDMVYELSKNDNFELGMRALQAALLRVEPTDARDTEAVAKAQRSFAKDAKFLGAVVKQLMTNSRSRSISKGQLNNLLNESYPVAGLEDKSETGE